MSSLTCREFVELVTRYLDGAMDAAEQARFAEHLATCPGCERYLDQFQTTIEALGGLPTESISDDARDRLLAAFRTWSAG